MVEIAISYVEECARIMAKYLARICPKCGGYLGVVIPEPKEPTREIPVDAKCLRCGFDLLWKIVTGNRGLEREAREQGRGHWGKST